MQVPKSKTQALFLFFVKYYKKHWVYEPELSGQLNWLANVLTAS